MVEAGATTGNPTESYSTWPADYAATSGYVTPIVRSRVGCTNFVATDGRTE